MDSTTMFLTRDKPISNQDLNCSVSFLIDFGEWVPESLISLFEDDEQILLTSSTLCAQPASELLLKVRSLSEYKTFRSKCREEDFWMLAKPCNQDGQALQGYVSNIPPSFLKSTKTRFLIDSLFQQVKQNAEWALFPWGSAFGLEALAFVTHDLTQSRTFLEQSVIRHQIESVDVLGPSYDLRDEPFSEIGRQFILRHFCDSPLFPAFERYSDIGSQGAYLVLDKGTIEGLPGAFEVFGIDESLFQTVQTIEVDLPDATAKDIAYSRSQEGIKAVCRWASEHDGDLFVLPTSCDLNRIADSLQLRYANFFIKDYEWLGIAEWYLSCGRSLEDCTDVILGSNSKRLTEMILNMAETEGSSPVVAIW